VSWLIFLSDAGRPENLRHNGRDQALDIERDLSGARIVTNILLKADAEAALAEVNVVTFSSRIYDANSFIRDGRERAKVRTDGSIRTPRSEYVGPQTQAVFERLDY